MDAVKEMRLSGRFDHYTDDELAAFAAACKIVENKADEVLFMEGRPGDSFCVVLRGEYQSRRERKGEKTPLGSGDIAGEMCVLNPDSPRRIADVIAVTEGAVLIVNKASLDAAVNRGESWAAKLMTHFAETLAGRLRELDDAYTSLWNETKGRDQVSELQAFRNTLREKWKL